MTQLTPEQQVRERITHVTRVVSNSGGNKESGGGQRIKTIIIALLVMLSAYTTYYWIQDEGWKDWGGKNSERALERAKKEKALTETAGVSGDLSRLLSDEMCDLDFETKNVVFIDVLKIAFFFFWRARPTNV